MAKCTIRLFIAHLAAACNWGIIDSSGAGSSRVVQSGGTGLTVIASINILLSKYAPPVARRLTCVFSAQNLIRIRKKRKLSQEGVARRSGLATVTISKLEEGKSCDPRMSTVRKLAKALDCSLEAFFADELESGRNGG